MCLSVRVDNDILREQRSRRVRGGGGNGGGAGAGVVVKAPAAAPSNGIPRGETAAPGAELVNDGGRFHDVHDRGVDEVAGGGVISEGKVS